MDRQRIQHNPLALQNKALGFFCELRRLLGRTVERALFEKYNFIRQEQARLSEKTQLACLRLDRGGNRFFYRYAVYGALLGNGIDIQNHILLRKRYSHNRGVLGGHDHFDSGKKGTAQLYCSC